VAATDDQQRIRKGLKFISKTDRRVVKIAGRLLKLSGISHPPGAGDLLKRFRFTVAGNQYDGKMTQQQNNYLVGYQASLREFADAVSRVILHLDRATMQAVKDLSSGLGAPAAHAIAPPGPNGVIPPPPTGCCSFDTNQQQDGVTEAFCEGGLQGNWDPNPCHRRPEEPTPNASTQARSP
jgi:hypothetical protein